MMIDPHCPSGMGVAVGGTSVGGTGVGVGGTGVGVAVGNGGGAADPQPEANKSNSATIMSVFLMPILSGINSR